MGGPKAQVKAVFPESAVHFEVVANTPIEQLCSLVSTFRQGHSDLLLIEIPRPRQMYPKTNGEAWYRPIERKERIQ
jgi:hypothetical protein